MGIFGGTTDADAGKQVLNNLVIGTGVGSSAMGLYYLAKKLRKRFEEQLERSKPQTLDYTDVALDVPALPAPAQKKLAFNVADVGMPLAGGAAGAILSSALSDKKTKKRNAILGGLTGAVAGAGLNTKPVHEFIGRNIPSSDYPMLTPILGDAWFPRGSGYKAWKTMANIGGAGLGVLGGKALYDLSAAPYIEAEKQKERYDNVESARKKYFEELLNDEEDSKKKEKKSSVNATLDAAYARYAEKKSSWNPVNWVAEPLSLAIAGTTVGTGLLGAKYMYDKTMAASRAKNTAKALAARERMKNVMPVWIDPKELALVADAANAKETQDDKGV